MSRNLFLPQGSGSRPHPVIIHVTIGVGLLLFLAFCLQCGAENSQSAPGLYQRYCRTCHGAEGDGRGPAGMHLQPPPPDLTNASFMRSRTDAQLARAIREGLKGSSMQAWNRHLTDEQIDALVKYIRSMVL